MCGIGLIVGQRRIHLAGLEHILRFRGPDIQEVCHVEDIGWLVGCVLHIQGDHVAAQPHHDADGNFFLWNGEMFGRCDITGAVVKNVAEDEPGMESDTIIVSRMILAALQQCADARNAESSNDTAKVGQSRLQLLSDVGNSIAIALASIAGPYAFIFVCSKLQCIVYGRDPFGRRSLLTQSSGEGGLLSIASVRPFQSGDALPPSPTSTWTEVPVSGIFVASVCENEVARPLLIPWPDYRLRLGRRRAPTPAQAPTMNPDEKSLASQMLLDALIHAIKVRVCAMRACVVSNGADAVPNDRQRGARIGVLFSGGIDSVILAAILHLCLDDVEEPIDLLNISFDGDTAEDDPPAPDRLAAIAAVDELQHLYPLRPFRLVHVDVTAAHRLAQEEHVKQLIYPCKTHMDLNIGMAFHAAACARGAYLRGYTAEEVVAVRSTCDTAGRPLVRLGGEDAAKAVGLAQWRQAAPAIPSSTCEAGVEPVRSCGTGETCRRVGKKGCIRGLCKRCCNASENSQADGPFCPVHKSRVAAAMSALPALPARAGLTEAADGSADGAHPPPTPYRAGGGEKTPYESRCKALLIGIGADEQCAGYGRHRTTYLREGMGALEAELDMDCRRLWERNLGRDDRCVGDSGREAWFPYLDEGVVRLLQSLPVTSLCDLDRPPGEGDKAIVRQVAATLGLTNTSSLVKRAIQFGTKIAKLTNIACHGSNRKGKGGTLMDES